MIRASWGARHALTLTIMPPATLPAPTHLPIQPPCLTNRFPPPWLLSLTSIPSVSTVYSLSPAGMCALPCCVQNTPSASLRSTRGASRRSHPATRPRFPWMCSEGGATEPGLQVLLGGSCEQTRVEAPGPGTHQIHAHIPGCRISNVVCGFCEKSLPMVHFVQASNFLFF